MAKLEIMDQTGHSTLEFTKDNALSMEAVMKAITERPGSRIAVQGADGKHDIVAAFNPDAENQLLIPPLVGG